MATMKCKVCGQEHKEIEACDENEIIEQCNKYRKMLEDICNDATYEWGSECSETDNEALVQISVIEQARALLGWEPL